MTVTFPTPASVSIVGAESVPPSHGRLVAGDDASRHPLSGVYMCDLQGRRNAGPVSPQTATEGGSGATKEPIGHGWAWKLGCLDAECNIEEDWAEELLFQRAEFLSSLVGSSHLVGNTKMAKRIGKRLQRED